MSNNLCSIQYLKDIFINKICYWHYFSAIFFPMKFIVLHTKFTQCCLGPELSAGVLQEGLQQGEQWARRCQGSAGLEGHHSAMSNMKGRAVAMRVMTVRVSCRPGIARWVPRADSCSLSSQNLSPQRNFRISQVRHFSTVFKLQSFILIISCNLQSRTFKFEEVRFSSLQMWPHTRWQLYLVGRSSLPSVFCLIFNQLSVNHWIFNLTLVYTFHPWLLKV